MDDSGSPTIGFIVLVIFLIMDAIIFGFNAAMQNLNEASVEKLSKEGNKKANLLMRYLDISSRYTHVCQLVMLVVHMLMGLVEIPLWKAFFFEKDTAFWVSNLQTVLLLAILSVIMLVFGIYIPEKIAARKTDIWAFTLVPVIRAIELLFYPLIWIMDIVANVIARLFGVDPWKNLDDVTEEEIISMVNEGHEQGVLLASEAEMIHNIFEFGDKEAKDIMIHRKNIIAIDGHMTFLEALDYIKDNNYSRFPVYMDDIDNIIGILHIKDALALSQEHEIFEKPIAEIKELLREVDFIPETRNINSLFSMMQSEKSHMMIVVDEYGQTAGVVAMEDILEEIVGNIEDEHDEEVEMIEQLQDGTYRMEGMTAMEDVKDILGIEVLEDDDFETLNGLLISQIGKIPSDDEVFSVKAYGYLFDVLSVENKMIKSVKVSKLPEEAETENEEETCHDKEMVVE